MPLPFRAGWGLLRHSTPGQTRLRAISESPRAERLVKKPSEAWSAYPWMSQPSVARAASITVSANAGCGWIVRATSE